MDKSQHSTVVASTRVPVQADGRGGAARSRCAPRATSGMAAGGRLPTVCVIGHFRLGSGHFDGQTVRTALVESEIAERLGGVRVSAVDTGYFRRQPLGTLYRMWRAFADHDTVIVMPGPGSLRFLTGWFALLGSHYGNRVHCLAVGGWLPDLLLKHPRIGGWLRRYESIQVQTRRMAGQLEMLGLNNVELLPNFRKFAREREYPAPSGRPLRLVFYSRVRPEKGIEHALEAVRRCNRDCEPPRVTMEIWGPIRPVYRARLAELVAATPQCVYRGVLPPDRPYAQLKEYDALVVPTFWEGEGFPGAVLDAYIAGLMVVTTRWKDIPEFVEPGVTGVLVEPRSTESLVSALESLIGSPECVAEMKRRAWERAEAFHVDEVIPPLLNRMGLLDDSCSPQTMERSS